MFHYHINPDSEIPIYRQLVDQINAQIRSGALKTGAQLPTVREMAEKLHLSCGTVKHVYDCLQKMGDIEMTRRRGTFVKYVRSDRDSRKQQAMNAIDHMIRKLAELNFSPAEIQIFLNLKMREWGLKWSGVRITVVTEYAELTPALEKQLGQIANVHVSVCSPRQLSEYPYSVDEQSDVILASIEDGHRLAHLLPQPDKLIRIAFRSETESLMSLAALRGMKLGVLCETQAFADLITAHAGCDCTRLDGADLEGVDALILARDSHGRFSAEMQQQVAAFREKHPVVEYACGLDEGSMLYLEERISKLRDERQLWPGALHF